jgi:hypothetical protein
MNPEPLPGVATDLLPVGGDSRAGVPEGVRHAAIEANQIQS